MEPLPSGIGSCHLSDHIILVRNVPHEPIDSPKRFQRLQDVGLTANLPNYERVGHPDDADEASDQPACGSMDTATIANICLHGGAAPDADGYPFHLLDLKGAVVASFGVPFRTGGLS